MYTSRFAGGTFAVALSAVFLVVALVDLAFEPGPVPFLLTLTFAAQLVLQLHLRRVRERDGRSHG